MNTAEIIAERRANKALWDKMEAVRLKAHGEKRSLTAEERQEWDRMDTEFEDRSKKIAEGEKERDRLLQHEARRKEMESIRDSRRAGREDTLDSGTQRGRARRKFVSTPESRERAELTLRAFLTQHPSRWDDETRQAIKETEDLLPTEVRALSQVTGSAGAYTIPQDFMPELDKALKSYSGMFQCGRLIETDSGADMPFPKVDDTSNVGEFPLAEDTATADTADPTYGSVTLKTYVASSKLVRVPIPLLVDSAFDMEADLFDMLGDRIGRIANTRFTLGSGSGQPRGLITALLADTTPIVAASTTAVAYGDVVKLEHGVDPAYRQQGDCSFVLHDKILQALKLLLDSNGRPIFRPANDAPGTPATLMGYPYFINQDMDSTLVDNNEIMAFGKLKKYIIRRGGMPILMRLNERYAEKFQAGFVAFDRLDGNLVSGGSTAVQVLQL